MAECINAYMPKAAQVDDAYGGRKTWDAWTGTRKIPLIAAVENSDSGKPAFIKRRGRRGVH